MRSSYSRMRWGTREGSPREHKIFRKLRVDKKLAELGVYEPPSKRLFHDIEGTARLLAREPESKHLLDVLDRWYTAYKDVLLLRMSRRKIDENRSMLPPPMVATAIAQTWEALRGVLKRRGFGDEEIATAAAVLGIAALHPYDAARLLKRMRPYLEVWGEARKAKRDDTSKRTLYSPHLTYLWPLNVGDRKAARRNRFGLKKMENIPISREDVERLERLRKRGRDKRWYYEELKWVIREIMNELQRRERDDYHVL